MVKVSVVVVDTIGAKGMRGNYLLLVQILLPSIIVLLELFFEIGDLMSRLG